MNKRLELFDVMKGLLIILMVTAHTQFFGHDFIFLFHMSCFFIISGYFYKPINKEKNIKDIKNYIIKKIKQLYLPFVIYNFFFLLINNIFYNLNIVNVFYKNSDFIKNMIYILLFAGRTTLTDSTWFLQTLFFVSILYYIIDFILVKLITNNKIFLIQFFLSIFFLLLGYYCSLHNFNIYQIGTILTCFIFYYFGQVLKKINILNNSEDNTIKFVLIAMFSFIFLFIFNVILKNKVIRIMQNQYYNPILLLILSLIGFAFIFSISYIITKNKNFIYLHKYLNYLGKHTISILALHISCFKIVNLIQIYIYKMNIKLLSQTPVLLVNNWYILYTFIGVNLPLLINFIINKGWKAVKKKKIFILLHNYSK